MQQGKRFRITGGVHKGRILKSPPDIKTRPMQGALREALFNIIRDRLHGASVLDLFSGTGSIGLEALSRGAATCAFFESYEPAIRILRQNIEILELSSCARIFSKDLLKLKVFPTTGFEPYDLIFLDPPFAFHDARTLKDLDPLIHSISAQGLMGPDPRLILQVRKKQIPPDILGCLSRDERRPYGSVALMIYKKAT